MTPRLATLNDAPACGRIVHDWIDGTKWMPESPGLAFLVDIMGKGIPLREFWVIGDPVAGYLSFEREISQINGLYVARPRAGLGKALVDAVKKGRDFVQLWTHEPNVRAHRFYHREGFVTRERKEEGRGDDVPELRMEWHL